MDPLCQSIICSPSNRAQPARCKPATGPSHLMLLGGEPLPGVRYINWNFVSSRREFIDQARDDWRNEKFARVPGGTESIPLP